MMPMWAPPTPPQDDNDVYIDHSLRFLYEPNLMPETQLPPVHIRKEHKKPRIETVTTRKQKQRKEEPPRVPRSLFDRPTAIQQKLRRELKMQKLKQGLVKHVRPTPSSIIPSKTVLEPLDQDIPEWLIHEDWALLQAVQSLLNLPLNLQVVSPAVIINWDLVADVVNGGSRVYRTPKTCKTQYENVIIPREEGRILYDVSPRKPKKQKTLQKTTFPTKNNRPMRTSHLFLQNGTTDLKSLYCSRFDLVKNISSKRPPPLRQTFGNPTLRNPRYAEVLVENNITYDQPLNPLQVATNRAERIAREKKQSQAAAQVKAAELLAAQRSQAAAAAAQSAVTVGAAVSAPTIAQAVQAQQLQPLVSGATTVMQSGTVQKLGQNVTAVSIARTIGGTGSIIVNAPGLPSNFATIAKSRTVAVAQPTTIAVTSALGQTVRTSRPIELTAITTGGQTAQVAGQARVTSQPGTTTTIPPQRIATLTGVTATVQQQLAQAAIAAKGLSQQQINIIRQQQSIVRQQTPQIRQKFNLTEQIRQPGKQIRGQLQGQKVITTLQMAQGHKIRAEQLQQIQRQQQQQRLLQVQQKPGGGVQGQITVQGTTTQHPTAQIISQTQVPQGVSITQGTSQAPVVTLVKSASQPSPVNISVNVGQQKHVITTRAATPLTAQQKVLLTQKRAQQLQAAQKGQLQKGQIPLIIPNQKLGQPLSGQHILHHLVKHPSSISQILPQNLIPVSSTGSGQQTQMITKVCIATTAPSSHIQSLSTAASPAVTQVTPVTAGQIQTINVITTQGGAASLVKSSVPSSTQLTTMQVRTVPSIAQQVKTAQQPLTQSLVTQPVHQVQASPNIQQIQVNIPPAASTTQVTQASSPAGTVHIQQAVPESPISVGSPSVPSPTVVTPTVPQAATVATIITNQTTPGQPGQPGQTTKQYGMRTRNAKQ